MVRENGIKALVKKIDDAIEQAEDLGLAFIAGILMMARLEALQTDNTTASGSGNGQQS
jgi:hypothetical protein